VLVEDEQRKSLAYHIYNIYRYTYVQCVLCRYIVHVCTLYILRVYAGYGYTLDIGHGTCVSEIPIDLLCNFVLFNLVYDQSILFFVKSKQNSRWLGKQLNAP